jgi:hypothetical protein
MDSDYFYSFKIYRTFDFEYQLSDFSNFVEFIKSKDLGIILDTTETALYKIVDHKKWAITKIKYGF